MQGCLIYIVYRIEYAWCVKHKRKRRKWKTWNTSHVAEFIYISYSKSLTIKHRFIKIRDR